MLMDIIGPVKALSLYNIWIRFPHNAPSIPEVEDCTDELYPVHGQEELPSEPTFVWDEDE